MAAYEDKCVSIVVEQIEYKQAIADWRLPNFAWEGPIFIETLRW